MATIKTAISIYDGMSGPLKKMVQATNILISSFESMQSASNNAVDTAALRDARDQIAEAAAEMDQVEQNIRDSDAAQRQLNDDLERGTDAAGGLLGKLKGIVAAYAGIQGLKKAFSWIKENLSFADTQRNVETQLKTVLANVGATEDAFDHILSTASTIQKNGIYGDEAMIGGAAELATYISDVEAIQSMMGTLSNYAMGMSGGGEVDAKTMVDYATQLGKALEGTYDGLTKKGFVLSDAQKEIIENGTDMERALVLEEVIAQSWDQLYETMSNTPEGKIISLKNLWGDLRETLGNRLYPVVLKLINVFTTRFPQIETIMGGLARGAEVLVGVMIWLIEGAIGVANAFVENWGWISPIIYGAAAAMLAYQVATKGAAIATGIATAAKTLAVPIYSLLTGATMAETAAQWGLNAALYACPVVWIIIAIIAIIALLYAAVAAINHFAGTSVSATGIIAGAIAVAAAFIGNLFVALINFTIDIFVVLWNFIAAFANFFGNVFTDPVGAIARLFFDLVDTVLSLLQSLASAIDTIVGSNLSGAVQGWRDNLGSWVDSTFGSGTEIMAKMNAEDMHLGRFEYGSAWDSGYAFGEGIEDKVSGMFDFGDLDAFNIGNTLDGIYDNTGDTAANTAAGANSLEIAEEDWAYMRDIAEREAINRFTTAEIKVEQTNHNNITPETDVDGIMDAWAVDFAEKLDISEEGVHE